jgi:glycosyltransferase involved in cell wall biosynthesis
VRVTSDDETAVAASVIVPARDAARTLPRTLSALADQDFAERFEVIVVDDGSRDGTSRVAARVGARVIRHEQPIGPGAARNAGAEAANGEVLAFTDADCAPAPGWLAAGAAALEDAGLVQGRVEPRPGIPAGPFDRTLWVTAAVGLFESANLFVRHEVFERLGGFDDGLLDVAGAHFGEDVIFGWRAVRAGVDTAFSEDALAHHEVFPRAARPYLRERLRLAFFPELARRVPELRRTLFYRRWFLNERSARFALAAVGGLAARAVRSPLPALAALPYARLVAADAHANGVPVALGLAAGDALGFAALASGSLRFRSLLL